MTDTTPTRCPSCGARVNPHDRGCFVCGQLLTTTVSAPAISPEQVAAPAKAAVLPDPGPVFAPPAPRSGALPAAHVPPQPTLAPTTTPQESHAASEVTVELRYGAERRLVTVTSQGASIGSSHEADIRLSAGFLEPVHARLLRGPNGWLLRAESSTGSIIHRGVSVGTAEVQAGDAYRISDRAGNFVTLRVVTETRPRREGALRAALPSAGESFLLGSDPSCAVVLRHPLVQRHHATLLRDTDLKLWLDDRRTAAGTYVNGQRLKGKMELNPGDLVQIGPFTATVTPSGLEPLEQVPGVHIRARHAAVTVDNGSRDLLSDVTVDIEPASLTAVIGPSGAGKTTLMRLLSGQAAVSRGTLTYNSANLADCLAGYSELMGFVPQDDIVHAGLTVNEALGFQARLRLGDDVGEKERQSRVTQLLGMMGLNAQANQLVSTLSGGQRKRVSIACELLTEPQLLFLDEPTSGLDPGLDKRMMLLLRLLADQGRTVVVTTHAIAHVDVCDTLILVGAGGQIIYAGPPESAAPWFGVGDLGDVFSVVDSPSSAREAAQRRLEVAGSTPSPSQRETSAPPSGRARPPWGSPAWKDAFRHQLSLFVARQWVLLRRDRAGLAFTLAQGIVVALLTWLVAPSPLSWSDNSNTVVFVFGCSAVWFGLIGSVREIVAERPIWRREVLAGGNVSAYLASKIIIRAALGLVQALTMSIVMALTLGLPTSNALGMAAVTVTVCLWLGVVAGAALGLTLSAASRTSDSAQSLVPYVLVVQLVLSGVLFHLGAMTVLSWLVPARWAVSSLGGVAGLSAAALQQSSGLYPSGVGGLLGNWLALLVITAGCLALAGWALVRQARAWQSGQEEPPSLWSSITAGVRSVGQRRP